MLFKWDRFNSGCYGAGQQEAVRKVVKLDG
jgi:hypothetical protein